MWSYKFEDPEKRGKSFVRHSLAFSFADASANLAGFLDCYYMPWMKLLYWVTEACDPWSHFRKGNPGDFELRKIVIGDS